MCVCRCVHVGCVAVYHLVVGLVIYCLFQGMWWLMTAFLFWTIWPYGGDQFMAGFLHAGTRVLLFIYLYSLFLTFFFQYMYVTSPEKTNLKIDQIFSLRFLSYNTLLRSSIKLFCSYSTHRKIDRYHINMNRSILYRYVRPVFSGPVIYCIIT